MGIIKVITGLFGTWALGKYGRKPLLGYGVLTQGICFFILFILIHLKLDNFLFFAVGVYLMGYALGVGATTLIYTADVLPPNGIGIALAV